MLKKFQTRPVTIEAIQFTDDSSANEIIDWIGNRYISVVITNDRLTEIHVDLASLTINRTDWIVRREGKFIAYSSQMFKQIYEPVGDLNG